MLTSPRETKSVAGRQAGHGPAMGAGGQERRQDIRKKVQAPGLLAILGHLDLVPCRVLNRSASGMRVLLTTSEWRPAKVPCDVTLSIPSERLKIRCTAVWIVEREIGLRFAAESGAACGEPEREPSGSGMVSPFPSRPR